MGGAIAIYQALRYLIKKYYDTVLEYLRIRKSSRRNRKFNKIRNYLLEEVKKEEEEITEERGTRSGRRHSVSAILLGTLLAINHIRNTAACDRSLYIKT